MPLYPIDHIGSSNNSFPKQFPFTPKISIAELTRMFKDVKPINPTSTSSANRTADQKDLTEQFKGYPLGSIFKLKIKGMIEIDIPLSSIVEKCTIQLPK